MNDAKNIAITIVWYGRSKEYGMNYFRGGIRNSYILHYVTKGKGYLTMAGQTHTIHAGDSFLIYPDIYVEYHPDEDDPWEYEWLNFLGAPIKDYLKCINVSPEQPVFRRLSSSPKEIFDNAISPSASERSAQNFERISSLLMLFSFYADFYPKKVYRESNETFTEICDFIDANLNRTELNISLVAKKFGLSRATLFRLFQKNNGMSPADYIIHLKIQKATYLLCETNLSVKSIAFSLGFSDPLYFSRFFKRYTGFTPSYCRKNKRYSS